MVHAQAQLMQNLSCAWDLFDSDIHRWIIQPGMHTAHKERNHDYGWMIKVEHKGSMEAAPPRLTRGMAT